jgi:hypothetical protein
MLKTAGNGTRGTQPHYLAHDMELHSGGMTWMHVRRCLALFLLLDDDHSVEW